MTDARTVRVTKGSKDRPLGRPPIVENARNRIILEAAALFARQGYQASTLADVAKAIGVSKAGIYHYFSTKQQIYDAIIYECLVGLDAAVSAAQDENKSCSDNLSAIMEAHAEYFEANYASFATMLVGFGGMNDDHLKREVVRLRDSYEQELRELILLGVKRREFRECDPAVAARLILSALNWMVRWFVPGRDQAARAVALDYHRLLVDGLRC